MVCRIAAVEGVVLVSHNPVSVFTTTEDHIARVKAKPDGHYARGDLLELVERGDAVLYDAEAVRAVMAAANIIIFGCPPA